MRCNAPSPQFHFGSQHAMNMTFSFERDPRVTHPLPSSSPLAAAIGQVHGEGMPPRSRGENCRRVLRPLSPSPTALLPSDLGPTLRLI